MRGGLRILRQPNRRGEDDGAKRRLFASNELMSQCWGCVYPKLLPRPRCKNRPAQNWFRLNTRPIDSLYTIFRHEASRLVGVELPGRREEPHGLSIAHDSLDSDAGVCWFLIVVWKKLSLAGPGCLCSVSRICAGISSSRHVHNQATSARETSRPFAELLKSSQWTFGLRSMSRWRCSPPTCASST